MKRASAVARWREYEQRKAAFLGQRPGAPPQDFEAFIRGLAIKLGL